MTNHSPLSVPAGGARGVEGAQTRALSPLEAALAAWNAEPRLLDVHRMLMALEAYDKARAADPESAAPQPEVGQVWVSPNKRIENRTIVKIAGHKWWPGEMCVHFVMGNRDTVDTIHPNVLHPASWRSWVRKSGARPVSP